MSVSFETIRAKLEAAKNRQRSENPKSRAHDDSAGFPFWNQPEGSTTTVRFINDGDPENEFFWKIRDTIKIPFDAGSIGGDFATNKPVVVSVTSPTTFGMKCPIGEATKHLWKEDRETALRYWRRRQYLMQGFIVSTALQEETLPANPIRRLVLNKSLFEILEQAFSNPDIEDLMTDPIGGRDFRLVKTRKGEWANYSSSSWAMKARPLNDSELRAIDEHKPFVLKDFLGAAPDQETLDMLAEMVAASLACEPFDVTRWGSKFRAFTANGESQAAAPAPAPSGTAKPLDAREDAAEILARIRNKSKAA